jgi:hypothetical protein
MMFWMLLIRRLECASLMVLEAEHPAGALDGSHQ